MKPEEQRIAIAEACGWTDCKETKGLGLCFGKPPSNWIGDKIMDAGNAWLPNYPSDLNAMHEAFAQQPSSIQSGIVEIPVMNKPTSYPEMAVALSTAEDWARAYLETLNLWKPAKD